MMHGSCVREFGLLCYAAVAAVAAMAKSSEAKR